MVVIGLSRNGLDPDNPLVSIYYRPQSYPLLDEDLRQICNDIVQTARVESVTRCFDKGPAVNQE